MNFGFSIFRCSYSLKVSTFKLEYAVKYFTIIDGSGKCIVLVLTVMTDHASSAFLKSITYRKVLMHEFGLFDTLKTPSESFDSFEPKCVTTRTKKTHFSHNFESFCPCTDPLWLKWVKWFTRVFLCTILDFSWTNPTIKSGSHPWKPTLKINKVII